MAGVEAQYRGVRNAIGTAGVSQDFGRRTSAASRSASCSVFQHTKQFSLPCSGGLGVLIAAA